METREIEQPTTGAPEAVSAQRRFGIGHQLRSIVTMRPKRLSELFLHTYSDWAADNATRLGASLAYYTLFSVAPVLIVITGVVGFIVGHATAQAQIAPWLQRFLSPEGARAAELMLKEYVTPTGGIIATAIGLVTLFLATSAFINEIRQSMNVIWKVSAPPSQQNGAFGVVRSLLTDRLYGFLIAIGAGVVILLLLAFNTAVTFAASYFHGSLPVPASLLHLINFAVTLLLMTGVFALVYKTLPDAYVAWGDACVGAAITAFLFDVGSLVLSAFIGHMAASPYGTAAGVLALLTWVYYSAQVFFFGAEFSRIFATTHGGGIIPMHRAFRGQMWRRSLTAS